jgi:photosystem II stability/assembly factor-like uncharacterized protein
MNRAFIMKICVFLSSCVLGDAQTAGFGPAPSPALPAELSLGEWRPVGPWNFSGKAFDIAVSPSDSNTIYAAYGFAGIWKTADGGKTWLQLNDPTDLHQFPCVTVHPRFPNVLVACLGQPDFPVFTKGLIYSSDGGRHWDLTAPSDGLSKSFYRVVFDPADPNTFYAASDQGVYLTRDRGANWSRILAFPGNGRDSWDEIPDLVMKPDDPSVLIAAQKNLGVYRTSNGGATWARVDQAMDTATITSVLAWSQSDANTIYCQRNDPDGLHVNTYLSTSAGVAWTPISRIQLRTQSRYDMSMAVDPQNPSRVLIGNADFGVSIDGLRNVQSPSADPHPDHLRIIFDPSNPNVVYDANDGGIWRSADRGQTWSRFDIGVDTNLSYGFDTDTTTGVFYLSPGDYGGLQYDPASGWHAARIGGEWATFYVDPSDSATAWYAGPDNLAVTHDRGQTWSSVDPDKGAPRPGRTILRFDPINKGTLFFTTDKVWVSHDSGSTWTIVARSRNGWITDLLFDPVIPGTIYVSEDGGILRSTDNGVSWTETTSSVTNGFPYHCGEMAPVYGTKGAFYMSDYTRILLVTNGGTIAQSLPGTPFPNNQIINGVTTDPNHPERLFVAASAGLFFSDDYGETWKRLGRNLPSTEVFEILIKRDVIYAGTRHGIWQFSSDASWEAPPPANLVANAVSPTSVVLTWAPRADSFGVRLFRNGSQTYVGTENSFSDQNLIPGTQYCYTALDTNSAGEGQLSAPVCATPRCDFSLGLSGQAFSSAGGIGTITITTAPGCPWSIGNLPAWVTLTSAASGMGSGTVTFQVLPNSGADQSGSFTIAGQSFTIEQESTSIPGLNFVGSMPHLAAEGGWNTTFTLVNKSSASVQTRPNLFGYDGSPLALPLTFPQLPPTAGSLLGASVDRTLAANASLIVQASGPASVPYLEGSAQLAATGAIDGFEIFHYDPTTQEAVVPLETRNASSYLLAFDNTDSVVGVALANVSSQAANIPVVIRDDTGTQIGTGSISLNGNGHKSFVLSTQFPATANIRGTVEFDTPSGGQISALGIRFTPPNNAMTTIPTLANVGTSGGSIAHIATGHGWQTTFVLVNTGASSAQVHLKFFADVTGAPLSLPLSFPQSASSTVASSVDQTLAVGATLLVLSAAPSANPTSTTGSAQLTTDGKVSGFVIFRYTLNGQEAVVPLENRNANAYILAFDNTSGTATGIAINSVSSQTVNVPVVIRDDTGAQIATDTLNLAANAHLAFTLVTDKYPATANIRGTIEFDTPPGGQIGALGIRVPITQTFTTLPALVK